VTSEGHDRTTRLREALAAHEVDALIISSSTNIRYATGFTGSNGTAVLTADSLTLFTDRRYTAWAEEEVAAHDPRVEIVIAPGSGRKALIEHLDDAAMIGLEAADISWAQADAFTSDLGPDRVVATTGVIEAFRERKSASEVDALRRAATIADVALAALTNELRPGLSEVAIARMLAEHMYEQGGAVPSFDIIVASGPNSARPHHEPTERLIEMGDLLIIDSGATVDGYRSDMTRTFVFGPPTDQQRQMLDAVMSAQRAGVEAIGVGVESSAIDAACRSSITDAGLGSYFTHGTGHGVGLDIHEAPSVSSASTATLAPGHVITVEPGVYIPNVGGVRWEDTVVVTNEGAETLTKSPKQPLIER